MINLTALRRSAVEGPCLPRDDIRDAPENEANPKRLPAFRTGDRRVSLSTFRNVATFFKRYVRSGQVPQLRLDVPYAQPTHFASAPFGMTAKGSRRPPGDGKWATRARRSRATWIHPSTSSGSRAGKRRTDDNRKASRFFTAARGTSARNDDLLAYFII
jgi:hypothetical protein